MISVIISSFKEPKTIGKCIECIGDSIYSGIEKPFEIIQVSPDEETLNIGRETAKKLNLSSTEYRQVIDPHKGKPFALNMAIKEAIGDILIFTDGDTYFEKNAVRELLRPFNDQTIGGVSGRPISADEKNNMFAYWGHLLADSADHRRKSVHFFPMSGYIMAVRKADLEIPQDILSDDAYISYELRNREYNIGYAPDAVCYVKYPRNLNDYYKQKVRSIGGFRQLKRLNILRNEKQSRSFFIELGYAFFALRYAKNIKEFIWTICLFPVRLITWIKIIFTDGNMKADGWDRIESTK